MSNYTHSQRFYDSQVVSMERMSEFNKEVTYGSEIYECSTCFVQRVYGRSGRVPENRQPLILCEGECHKHTIHVFLRVHIGRSVNI